MKLFIAMLLRAIDGFIFRWKVFFGYKLYGLQQIYLYISNSNSVRVLYLLKSFGASIGKNVSISGPLFIENADQKGDFSYLTVGANTYLGKNLFLDLTSNITIEDNCAIAHSVIFLTHADPGERPMRQYYKRKVAPINIGRGSWIGAGAIILPGITIGKLCVIGAGTIVTKDLPDSTRIITKIIYEEKNLLENSDFLTPSS
jgi:acetyltransferase-like isoleucine patch superfamily enzyme